MATASGPASSSTSPAPSSTAGTSTPPPEGAGGQAVATLPLPRWEPRAGPLPEPFQRVIQVWAGGKWEKLSRDKKRGAQINVSPSPFCEKKAVHGTVSIPGASLLDYDVAMNDDRERLRPQRSPFQYDELVQKLDIVAEGTNDDDEHSGLRSYTQYGVYKVPVRLIDARDQCLLMYPREPLSDRHLAECAKLFSSETGRVLATAGFESDAVGPTKKCVRGYTHCTSLWGVEQRDRVDIHFVASYDPGGNLPTAVVDASNRAIVDKLVAMAKIVGAARDARVQA